MQVHFTLGLMQESCVSTTSLNAAIVLADRDNDSDNIRTMSNMRARVT